MLATLALAFAEILRLTRALPRPLVTDLFVDRPPSYLPGVVLALLFTGTTLNVQSLMGVLMMVGMVVSNSILIVEFTHQLEHQGVPLLDAVVDGCRIRLRPILMTSLATGLALVLAGTVSGTLVFLGLGRVLESLLYGVGPRDPLVLGLGAALLAQHELEHSTERPFE